VFVFKKSVIIIFNMIIRPARKKDIPVLLDFTMRLRKIENFFSNRVSCGEKTKSFFEKAFHKIVVDKNFVVLVAKEKEVLGIIYGWKEYVYPVYKNDYVGYIADVIVAKEERSKGIGKLLLKEIEKEFKKKGLKETKLLVLKNNFDAHKLWEKSGYEDFYIEMRKDLV
jgi:ribosomal protein S18 acetylase RimI-like enzyme